MKKNKILITVLFIAILTSCSSKVENNDEIGLSSKTSNEILEVIDFDLLAEETKTRLNDLLSSKGFEGIDDENLEIGHIDENQRFQSNNFQKQILSLYTKTLGLEHKCDADFENFVYISADENNEFPMLISNGLCKTSKENTKIAIDVMISQNDIVKIRKY